MSRRRFNRGMQCLQGLDQQRGDGGIGGELCVGESVARQRERDAGAGDEPGHHHGERFSERRRRVDGMRGGIQQADRLVEKFAAGNDPIQGVLQCAGDAVRVLGGADQHGIGVAERGAERCHGGGGRSPIKIGIEQRQAADVVVAREGERAGGERMQAERLRGKLFAGELLGGAEDRAIGRCLSQAAGDGQDGRHGGES